MLVQKGVLLPVTGLKVPKLHCMGRRNVSTADVLQKKSEGKGNEV